MPAAPERRSERSGGAARGQGHRPEAGHGPAVRAAANSPLRKSGRRPIGLVPGRRLCGPRSSRCHVRPIARYPWFRDRSALRSPGRAEPRSSTRRRCTRAAGETRRPFAIALAIVDAWQPTAPGERPCRGPAWIMPWELPRRWHRETMASPGSVVPAVSGYRT